MLTSTDFDTRRARVIAVTGEAPTNTVTLQLNQLKENGILVDLHVTGTGIFQKTPNWLELGIAEWTGDDRRADQFSKGQKYLFPEEKVKAVKSIESRLRQNLQFYSFDVTGIKPYRWLPYTAYQAWREKHDQIVAQGNALRDDLVVNRDHYVDQIAEVYTQIAEKAWVSVTSGTENGRRIQRYEYVSLTDKTGKAQTLDHEAFISYIVSSTVAEVPTAAEIDARLRFDYTTALVSGLDDLAAEQARADSIRLQTLAEREQLNLARQYQQTENAMLLERARKEAWNNQQEQTEREAKLSAMREAEMEHHREQLKETISPFAEVYRAAISQFIDHARDILESVKKNGYVRGKVAERGRGLFDLYEMLVLPGMGDDRLQTYLRELKAMLPADAESRSPEQIADKLREIIDLESQAEQAITTVSTFDFIDLN